MREHRFAQLDAIRALAVIAVVASHTVDLAEHPWVGHGSSGVALFFVISGFLITGILLDARRDATAAGQPIGGVFRAFYVRRALRIFPLYYVTIVVGTIIGVNGLRESVNWNLVYLSNWQIAFDGRWIDVTHIWSLAVEEQFYLVWPLVVLLAPRRVLPWAIGSMVLVAVTTRVVLTLSTDMWSDGIDILTPSVLDSLGLGAMLALLWRVSPQVDRIVRWVGLLGVAVLAVDVVLDLFVPSLPDLDVVTDIRRPLIFVWIVHRVARGVHGRVGAVLSWRPLAYIGVVSYGIYMFHLFVVPVRDVVERHLQVRIPIPDQGFDQFAVVGVISVAAAALSWTVLERPINDQKRRFPYVRPDVTPVVGAGATSASRGDSAAS